MERCNRGKYKKRILKQDTERFVLCVCVCMCVQLVKPAAGKRKVATPRSEVMEARDLFLRTFLASLPPFASELALFHPPWLFFFCCLVFLELFAGCWHILQFRLFPTCLQYIHRDTQAHTNTVCVHSSFLRILRQLLPELSNRLCNFHSSHCPLPSDAVCKRGLAVRCGGAKPLPPNAHTHRHHSKLRGFVSENGKD